MESIKAKYKNSRKQYVSSCFIILLFFSVCFFNEAFAQSADSSTGTATVNSEASADTSGGPSFKNLSKTSSAITEKLEEEARWNTIVSYIQMAVGFIIVIVVAWLLASWARKKELKKAEEKAQRVEKALQNRPPGTRTKRR